MIYIYERDDDERDDDEKRIVRSAWRRLRHCKHSHACTLYPELAMHACMSDENTDTNTHTSKHPLARVARVVFFLPFVENPQS
jgi:hypothetical protein